MKKVIVLTLSTALFFITTYSQVTYYRYCDAPNAQQQITDSLALMLDLNNDGSNDAKVVAYYDNVWENTIGIISLRPYSSGVYSTKPLRFKVNSGNHTIRYASGDNIGVYLDPGESYSNSAYISRMSSSNQFPNNSIGYICYRFDVDYYYDSFSQEEVGIGCYGWIKLSVNSDKSSVTVLEHCGCDKNKLTAGQTFTNTTGITNPDISSHNISVFLDPSNTILNVITFDDTPQSVLIYNVSGQKVGDYPYSQEIDISTLSKGMYVVKFEINGKTAISRFFKN